MSLFKQLAAEIRFRWVNFSLSLAAIAVAGALFVAGPTLVDGYARQTDDQLARLEDSTRKLMRDMGFNLMIVHRDANMADLWADDYAALDMPEDYVHRLAARPELTLVTHLVATLQQRIGWRHPNEERERTALLIGYLPETPQSHMGGKKPMGHAIEPGTVLLGYELGGGLAEGDAVEVQGKSFRVARVLSEKGSKEDIVIAMHLSDAQAVLEKPGRVNQIMALGCRCEGERLPKIRAQLAAVLPEAKISEHESIALARAEQRDEVAASRGEVRDTLRSLAAVTLPLVVLASGIWVGVLAMANVRERRAEIGLLRALGKGSREIAALFLGKAVLLGLAGGLLGALVGVGLGRLVGEQVLGVASGYFEVAPGTLAAAILGAPLLAALASYLPALAALTQDPAVVLQDP